MRYKDIPVLDGGSWRKGGHLGELATPDGRLALLRRIAEHPSPIVALQTPGGTVIAINSPEAMAEVLVEHAKVFEKAFMTRHTLAPLGGEGLFTAEGELWKAQRKLMSPMFQPSQIDAYGADMIACTDRALSRWPENTEFSMADETTRITMSIAGKTLFDADTFSEADEIGHALTVALDWVASQIAAPRSFFSAISYGMMRRASAHVPARLRTKLRSMAEGLTYPKYLRRAEDKQMLQAIDKLDNYVAEMVRERRANPGAKHDLLSRLLGAYDDENQTRMSDKQLRDEVLTLFVAGHETTATSLAWALYYLCKDSSMYALARAEVDALRGKTPGREDLPRLGYLLRVFKESLRIMPPVYLTSRQPWKDVTIAGYEIPAGRPTLVSAYAAHYREDVWPNPTQFDPDRFLPENEAKRHKLAWLPFAAGPRVCIGNHFALMEGQLVLARILQRFDVTLMGDDEPAPLATLRPKHGVRVRVQARSNDTVRA